MGLQVSGIWDIGPGSCHLQAQTALVSGSGEWRCSGIDVPWGILFPLHSVLLHSVNQYIVHCKLCTVYPISNTVFYCWGIRSRKRLGKGRSCALCLIHWWILEDKTDVAWGLYFISMSGRGGHPRMVCQNKKDNWCSIIPWPIRWQGYDTIQIIIGILGLECSPRLAPTRSTSVFCYFL